MRRPRKPGKTAKAARAASELRQRVAHDRSKGKAIRRENHLRELMGLSPRVFADGTSNRNEP